MSISSADEFDVSSSLSSYVSNKSKRRENAEVESASAPKRRSQRIASQSSLSVSQLKISSLNLPTFASDTDTDTNINETNEKEREWWLGKGPLGALDIDEER